MRTPLSIATLAFIMAQNPALAETIDPIIVTANNIEQPLSTATSPTYVITRDEIEAYGWTTLTDALKNLPGVSYTQNGGLGSTTNLYLRGQSGNAILVMIDGIQIADPSNTKLAPLFENLLLSDVERIEVATGPQSSVWGSNASAGVINIITQGQKGNHFSISAGSENTRTLNAKVTAGNERLGFSASLGALSTDGFTAIKPYDSNGDGYEADAFTQQDVAFNVHMVPAEHHKLEAGYRLSQADLEYDSTYPTYNPDDTASNTDSRITLQYLRYNLNHDRWLAQLQLSENKTERNYFGSYTGLLTSLDGRLGWKYHNHDSLNLNAGHQTIKGHKPAPFGFNQSYQHDYYGLVHNHRIGQVQMVEAIRQDNFDAFKDKTTGKIGFKAPLTKLLSISANYGTAYNAPSAYQVANVSGTLQTEPLKPESTEGWDATITLGRLSLTRFVSQTDNLIQYDLTGFTGYYNLDGTAHFDGWTLDYRHDFNQFGIRMNGTLQNATDNTGTQLLRVPQQSANITLDYFGLSKVDLALTLNYTGDYYEKAGTTSRINLGHYATVDMVLNYTLNRHFTLFTKAINLLDRDYYLATDQKNPPQYGYNTGGFQWRIGLRGKF